MDDCYPDLKKIKHLIYFEYNYYTVEDYKLIVHNILNKQYNEHIKKFR